MSETIQSLYENPTNDVYVRFGEVDYTIQKHVSKNINYYYYIKDNVINGLFFDKNGNVIFMVDTTTVDFFADSNNNRKIVTTFNITKKFRMLFQSITG